MRFLRSMIGYTLWDRIVGLGGLGVTCSPRDPRFPVSNPAEIDGFFQDVKILAQVLRERL